MVLDTCFLIDLQREFRAHEPGRAAAFLDAHRGTVFRISVISVTEFLEGFERPADGERLIRAYACLDIDSAVARRAAEFRRTLRLAGQLIGDFDILIAATAVTAELPLVTANAGHFARLSGLEIVTY